MQVLIGLVPVISEMKSAYDSYLEDSREESECEGNSGIVNDDVAGPSGVGENIPDAVTQDSMLYFDKVAGTSAPSEINVNENISKGVSKILAEGLSRETLKEISKKYAMPSNCPRLDVVHCNTEVYKNASPRARTKDSAPQMIQKSLLKGITAITFAFDKMSQNEGSDFADCQQKVEYASSVLKSLGFDISPKSALTPSQEIHHLGFILNSEHMTVTLSGDKREHVETLINKVLLTPMITVRTLAQTVGTLIACFPAIEYGQLYHRHLEILKINSLKTVYDFERLILLSEEAMSDLKWWLNDGLKSKKSCERKTTGNHQVRLVWLRMGGSDE
ncbi:Pol polyprotein [Plakobranchus ocellatus]|uniref:Pol polyprotein n=1 Tax=Plakobranchus ocellatus TaxID=259542 RepID=A0AAV4BZX4_9GAST|nr:Pol polyprotein [Plakobranchus ocellatus]